MTVPVPGGDTTTATGSAGPSPCERRTALVQRLWEIGAIRTEAVARAFRTVPRHLFVPEADLDTAYAVDSAVITKKDAGGAAISSVSAPQIQAVMAEQAALRPGMRVLEVGSGGCFAAILAELVGEDGEVTTMDIDPDVIGRAGRFLAAAGAGRVRVLLGDGEHGAPAHAPYDVIVVTVGAADVAPALVEQLVADGRLVIPLRMRGLTRSVAFTREEGRLVGRDPRLCGFVPMRGEGENRLRRAVLHDHPGEEVAFLLDEDQEADPHRLGAALFGPRCEVWPGVTVLAAEADENQDIDLRLATVRGDFVLLSGTAAARERGIIASAWPLGVAALAGPDSFAYRSIRRTSEEGRFELGAYGHGPDGPRLARELADEIRDWDRGYRHARARIEVHPAGTPDALLPPGRVIERRHSRITVSWP